MEEKFQVCNKIGLKPVSNELVDFNNDLLDDGMPVKSYIRQKLQEFSDKVESSVYNQKKVDMNSILIRNNSITFDLYSTDEIPILGRSIRSFSQSVLDNPYFERLLVQKKLFKTFTPVESTEDKPEIIDVSDIETKDLVIALVNILTLPDSKITKEVKTALDKMKLIAIEADILKL